MNGILIDNSGDIKIVNGKMQIGYADADITERILQMKQGELKEHPLIGANTHRGLNGRLSPFWLGNVKEQLKACKIDFKSVKLTDNGVEVEL